MQDESLIGNLIGLIDGSEAGDGGVCLLARLGTVWYLCFAGETTLSSVLIQPCLDDAADSSKSLEELKSRIANGAIQYSSAPLVGLPPTSEMEQWNNIEFDISAEQ